ncbi:uncharacterized protein LOC5501687 [Nematostella vectensis]|uniref:uncharacterized protein LOC5501687 n=1 Tax=Nematostella vectensis TaxID=45351 RepID=UPI00139015D9|nr:uncharacterized protein LOC5501687 [Nematostella vectensis]
MPELEIGHRENSDSEVGRKKARITAWPPTTTTPCSRTLELQGVIEVLKEYDSIAGTDINCCICGKLYKSKVCFTKHLWEHSVYWDTFDGVKNQERVLSIQAAIILSQPYLEFLLVTSPSNSDKRKEEMKPQGPRKLPRKRSRGSESSVEL